MNFVVKHCTTAVHILTNKCMYKQIGILYYTCCKYTLWCKKTAPFLVLWRFQFSKTRFGFVFLNPKTAVGFGLPGVKVNGAYLICDILLLKQLLPDIVKLLATFAFQRTTHAECTELLRHKTLDFIPDLSSVDYRLFKNAFTRNSKVRQTPLMSCGYE